MVSASVIVPTYKNPALLFDALKSIIAQQTYFEYEVLILDNSCDLVLRAEVENVAGKRGDQVRYIPVPEIGLHSGRHAGIKEAKSDILVFVDDDINAAQGWLQAIMDTFDDPNVCLVGGRNLPGYKEEPPNWLEAFWTRNPDGTAWCGLLSLLDYGNEQVEINPNFIWGVNFSIRKKTLVSVGGFHPDGFPWELRRYRGDGETAVTREVERMGFKAVYQPAATVCHIIPGSRLTIEYFERRNFLQGISDSYTRIHADHGHMPSKGSDWKSPLRIVKRFIGQWISHVSPDPYQVIRARISQAYQAGYKFHQHEVRRDPELLKWVMKEDYWDGRLSHKSMQV